MGMTSRPPVTITEAAILLRIPVLYDDRENSPTRVEVNEFFLGVHNPTLLQIPLLVLHGFKAIGTEEAIMLNLPTEPYRYDAPDEYRVDPRTPSVPYDWALKEK